MTGNEKFDNDAGRIGARNDDGSQKNQESA